MGLRVKGFGAEGLGFRGLRGVWGFKVFFVDLSSFFDIPRIQMISLQTQYSS